ncbi:MAG: hypothetical protein IT436_04650 [Phycisphaerales bacterium]|nr:hypothetical protein [Phycisphaerales bacterium]
MLAFGRALALPLYCATIIDPDTGALRSVSCGADGLAAMVAKLADANAQGWNVYYQPNPPRRFFKGSERPGKADIRLMCYAHAETDPRSGEPRESERARIFAMSPAGIPAPTITVDSGNVVQRLWRLPEPRPLAPDEASEAAKLRAAEEAERTNRALAAEFEGDDCSDVSRLLRWAGSVNWPSKTKRARGYEPRLSRLVEHRSERVYRLDELPQARPLAEAAQSVCPAAGSSEVAPIRVESVAGLPISESAQVVIANGADPDNPERFKSRSEAVWYVACEFARAMVKATTAADRSLIEAQGLGVLTDREWPISAHVFDQKSPERYARSQIRKALKEAAKEAKAPPPEGAIILSEGRLNENLRAGDAALLAAGVPIYERGGELVRPVRLEQREETGGVRRDAGATVIVPVSDRWLVQRLADSAPFLRVNAKGEPVPADPPLEFARHLMDRQGEWAFPTLRGIVNAPTMRRDGSILQAAGYDPASGLILDPCGVEFPPIPDEPTRDDALAALAAIDELFALFPYERAEPGQAPLCTPSYSVTLSALLCLVARHAMRTAPLHGNDSPTPGTGKTIQAEAVGIIGTGSLPAMMSQGPSDEELEKRIATALRAGDRVIVIDNVERPLGGDFLCSVLTQERVQARILGKSERVILPTSAVIIATGNNLQLAGDAARRAVKGRIDSGEERPDRREFPFDPRQLARERRPQLVAAALTILRAYHVAGRPVKLTPMGSFEDYSFVRGAIVWLDRADPARTRDSIFAADPKRDELTDLLRAWLDAFGTEAFSLADAKTRLETSAELAAGPLYGLLVDLGGRGAFNALSIGKRLAKFVDRPAGGLVLRRASEARIGTRWRVEPVGGAMPEPAVPDYGEFAGMGWAHRAEMTEIAGLSNSERD